MFFLRIRDRDLGHLEIWRQIHSSPVHTIRARVYIDARISLIGSLPIILVPCILLFGFFFPTDLSCFKLQLKL